jgi:hypothetical protein
MPLIDWRYAVKLNVKKLDATITKLQELRRLATDPALAPFIEITGTKPTSNGNTPHGANLAEAANGHGALKAHVLEACASITGNFTIKEVYAAMQAQGTKDSGTEKSVANTLRLLESEGLLRVAVRGQGRRPTSYNNI